MRYLDLTLATPAENLACDEALLEAVECGAGEVLRVWEPQRYFVVVGYANSVAVEVRRAECDRRRIPILRRCTGGGTVLQGPGCLNYSLVLRIDATPALHGITATNQFILERHQSVVSRVLKETILARGHTDLAIGTLKISGNAQRRRRRFLLFHGCFLLNMDLSLIERALPMPSKQPDYRCDRAHRDFLVNLRADEAQLKPALASEWGATEPLPNFPAERVEKLALEKYSRRDWNYRF